MLLFGVCSRYGTESCDLTTTTALHCALFPGHHQSDNLRKEIVLHADLVIVGAGVAGLTLAEAGRQRGFSVIVVDSHRPGSGTSRMAAGMLAPLVEARLAERKLLALGTASLAYWEDYRSRLGLSDQDIGFRSEGTILTGIEADHVGMIAHTAEEYRSLGLAIEELSREDLQELEPCLATSARYGYHVAGDMQVDNRALISHLVDRLVRSDRVTVVSDDRVTAIEDREGSLRVHGESGAMYHGAHVVLAPGTRLGEIEGVPSVLKRVIQPVKGEVIRLEQSAMPVLRHVVRTPEVYLVPKGDGTLVVGASTEERGLERVNRVGPVFELLRSAYETVPGVYELPIVELGVGHRPATIDHLPMVGRVGGSNLFIAAGYYRHGILFAPYCAELLVRYIESGTEPEELQHVRPDRFDRDNDKR